MLRFRYLFVYLVAFFIALNGSDACFRNNEDQKTVLTTGSPYYQECQCTEPEFIVQRQMWLNPHDQLIEEGPGTNKAVYTEETPDSINLHIASISKSMSGKYKCVIYANGKRYVQTYTLDAYEPLYFFKTPNDQYLTLERDSIITCMARGESLPTISWQRGVNDEFDDIQTVSGKYEILPEGLLIKNVNEDDAGKYKCTALVISTGEEVDKFIDVKVLTIPVITKLQASANTSVIGQTLAIECLAEGVPPAQYSWKKVGPETNQSWTQIINEIYFENITTDDEGVYECHASNTAGTSIRNIEIEVLVPPLIEYFPNITEIEGTTIQLVCNATGNPEPNITLGYEGVDFNSDWELSEYNMIPNKAFATLERSSEGIYICNASNDVGPNDIKAMYLTVLHRPYFKEDTSRVEWGYEGKVVKLSCAHDSNPPASITWRFESNAMPTDEQVMINKLLLNQLNERKEQYLTLNIDKNTVYGMYTCTARNSIGEATRVVFLKEGVRPPALNVSNINLIDLTATSVTFQIESEFSEDIPETLGYTAQYDEEWNYDITDIHPNRTWSIDRPFKIEKLKPNTTYNVSFAAINEVGAGEFTELLQFVTLEKKLLVVSNETIKNKIKCECNSRAEEGFDFLSTRSIPETPVLEEESLKSSPNGHHLLKWKEVDDNGEPVDLYVLKYCKVNEETGEQSCEVRHIKGTTELELTNLKANATYFLELIAHNAEGNSTPGNITITIPAPVDEDLSTLLSGGAIIGISILIVLVCLILLDLLLLAWRRQGILATFCISKDKTKEDALNSRDKKGLLVERVDTSPKGNNGHREFEYNRNTGIVTGKHSAV